MVMAFVAAASPAAAAPRLRARRRADNAHPAISEGVINDYVTWTVLGLAAVGGALALVIR